MWDCSSIDSRCAAEQPTVPRARIRLCQLALPAVHGYTDGHPRMPSTHELLILLIAIFALWFLLKVAKLAIKLILFVISIAVIAGVLWFLFAR